MSNTLKYKKLFVTHGCPNSVRILKSKATRFVVTFAIHISLELRVGT